METEAVVHQNTALIAEFVEALNSEHMCRNSMRPHVLAEFTVQSYKENLLVLSSRFSERRQCLSDATEADIRAELASQIEAGKKPNTIIRHLSSYRRFYAYLLRRGAISVNPAVSISRPKWSRAKDRTKMLTRDELRALFDEPDITTPLGYRDRMMMELLYTTGIGVTALCRLKIEQVDWETGVITVNGRGRPRDTAPLSVDVLERLLEFMGVFRGEILLETKSDYVFPTSRMEGMTRNNLHAVVGRRAKAAGISRKVSPNMLRNAKRDPRIFPKRSPIPQTSTP